MKTILSKKRQDLLYDTVHEEIMQARIKIWQMRNNKNISIAEIDDILSKLCVSVPDKAIGCFVTKKIKS
jgi:hypothetical protein